jgi:hypothetical protein
MSQVIEPRPGVPFYLRPMPPATSFEEAEADFIYLRKRLLEMARDKPSHAKCLASFIAMEEKSLYQTWNRGVRETGGPEKK